MLPTKTNRLPSQVSGQLPFHRICYRNYVMMTRNVNVMMMKSPRNFHHS